MSEEFITDTMNQLILFKMSVSHFYLEKKLKAKIMIKHEPPMKISV